MKNNKVVDWLSNSFAPKVNKIIENPWVSAISSSFTSLLPFILAGSVVYCYNVFRSYIPTLPDLSRITNFSFQLLGMYLAFIIPYIFLGKKKMDSCKALAGLLGISTLIMGLNPTIADGVISMNYGNLGPGGSLYGMIIGLLVTCVYYNWMKLELFKDSDTIPDFVRVWINNLVPIFLTLLFTMIVVNVFGFDLPAFLLDMLRPLFSFAESYIGLVVICLFPVFIYSLGISPWIVSGIRNPILYAAMAVNMAAVAAGNEPTNIVTYETIFTLGIITLGGTGATLPLNILMLRAKSKKLKNIGKICVGPSIFNINEPLVYGTPITFNPYLMLPMWICPIAGATLVWVVMKAGLLNIPAAAINIAQMPAPFSSILLTNDLRAIIWWAVIFVIYIVIWYPGFKAYDNKCLEEEKIAHAEN